MANSGAGDRIRAAELTRPARVLVVDDDEGHRYLLRLLIEDDDRVDFAGEAADGRQAIDAAERLQPDLIVLDIAMPVMGGLDALPHIRKCCPGARIVILSALPSDEWAHLALGGGAVGYLEKDASSRKLVDELLELAGLLQTVDDAITRARFAAAGTTPASARRFVDDILAQRGVHDVREIVELLVSELVTNAVIHAGSDVEVAVELLPAAVRVSVFDTMSSAPVLREPAADDLSGRGLFLVDSLAAGWGTEELAKGKRVWFEVERPENA